MQLIQRTIYCLGKVAMSWGLTYLFFWFVLNKVVDAIVPNNEAGLVYLMYYCLLFVILLAAEAIGIVVYDIYQAGKQAGHDGQLDNSPK